MDDILAIILKDTYSLTRYKYRLRLLKSNLLKTFFGGELDNTPAAPEDLNWLQTLPTQFYQKFKEDNVYEIFSGLEKMGASLPVLTMYLVFEPDDVTLNQIGSLARKTFNFPSLLLSFKIDPKLIAGVALAWKGIYRDYSLRAKIEERRNEIVQGFKKFLR